MNKPIKLTRPQRELLVDVLDGKGTVSMSYKPAQKLVDVGYCDVVEGKYGATRLVLTEFGRRKAEDLKGASNG